jgi:predicted enzyme related to lactoylglutathione lyase
MSKKKTQPPSKLGHFGWNELVTTNAAKAKKFYTALLGWKARPFSKGMPEYTIFVQGKDGIGGMMQCPQPGNPAQWIPYIFVKDVDATAKKTAKLGGEICKEPFDIPNVGRIAILADPQGAAFGIIKPKM